MEKLSWPLGSLMDIKIVTRDARAGRIFCQALVLVQGIDSFSPGNNLYEVGAIIMPLLRCEQARHRQTEKQPESRDRSESQTQDTGQQNLHAYLAGRLHLGFLASFALTLPIMLSHHSDTF